MKQEKKQLLNIEEKMETLETKDPLAYATKEEESFLLLNGIRPSKHRLSIYNYINYKKNHPTAEMIYNELLPLNPTLSKSTVYSILQLFIEKNVIQQLTIEGDEIRYDANIKPHIHFKCQKCGSIFDIKDIDVNTSIQEKFNIDTNFSIDTYQIFLWGKCSFCK